MPASGPVERKLDEDEFRRRQLAVLRRLVDHCDDHGLRYYLCAGTLLGAVRHGGYIPWDDDIDVMLPRADFERLCDGFDSGESIGLRAPGRTSGYVLPFAKLCDERTRLHVESDIIEDIGVYVDVFPVDGWCRRRPARFVQRRLLRLLQALMLVKHLSLTRQRAGARNALLRLAKALVRWLPTERISAGLTRVARWGSIERAHHAGVIVWGYQEQVPATAYGAPSQVSFEGMSLDAPRDPDAVLRVLYGDYMTPPPTDRQVTHHRFEAFALD